MRPVLSKHFAIGKAIWHPKSPRLLDFVHKFKTGVHHTYVEATGEGL